jgi:hypothetical protein
MSKERNTFKIHNVVLQFEGEHDERMALQVCLVSTYHCSTLTLCSIPTIYMTSDKRYQM